MGDIIEKLIQNSKSSQLACIEIHNKPVFPFRYEVCAILNINSWELLFKAYILSYHKEVKMFFEDGTTKPFDECLRFIASKIGKEFLVTQHNIEKIYEYRCNAIHFYQDDIDVLLLGLLGKNVLLYHQFLLKHFGVDIANETNLILLPIGFNKPISPIDFLSNESMVKGSSEVVQAFVKNIIKSSTSLADEGLQESILFSFKMSLINESRIKNADVVAAITKEKGRAEVTVDNVIGQYVFTSDSSSADVKKISIEETTVFTSIYTQTHNQVITRCKILFQDFVQNNQFYQRLNKLKGNPNFHKKRYLDIQKQSGGGKDYYSEKVYEELAKHYKVK